jgi:MSHA biogenesis protein MshI
LFQLFNRKKGRPGTTGVALTDKELSIAHVARDGAGLGVELQVCESIRVESQADAPRLLTSQVQKHSLANSRCNFVLSPDDYNLLLIEAPSVEGNEIAAAAKWKIKDMIDRPLDQLAVTVFRVPTDAYRSQREMIYVVAADRKKIQQVVEMVSQAGLELDSIDIPELVLKNVTELCYPNTPAGIATIDLRFSGSLMNLSKSEALYLTRHLNTHGGEEIMNSTDWSSVRDRLALEIQRSLDYYESQMGQAQISRILLMPRRNDSEKLAQQLNDVMGVRVEVMNIQGKLGRGMELPFSLQHDCMFAIGGALRVEKAA